MPLALIIDDSSAMRDLLTVLLTKQGFQVLSAENGSQGLKQIRSVRPHVVLLDIEMPDHDGIECLSSIRADPELAALPVLMVSGKPTREVVLSVARLGVRGLIAKNENLATEVVQRTKEFLVAAPVPSSDAPLRMTAKAVVLNPVSQGAPHRGQPTGMSDDAARHSRAGAACNEDDLHSLQTCLSHLADVPDVERATRELKQLRPLMTRAELMERVVNDTELKAIRPAVQQVLSLTRAATASIDAIARAIKQDQALALKVLKIANSAVYSRGDRIETIPKAVARIGVDQIRTTVQSVAILDELNAPSMAGRIRADWFWEHSIAVGLIASRLARFRNRSPTTIDAMFTAGLLHDVGRVIFAQKLGEFYSGVIDVADSLELPLEHVETRLLLLNHADLTDRLLRQWNFSAELVNPVAMHHLSVGNIRRIAPRMAEEVAMLAMANQLAHALVLGSSGNDVLYPIEDFARFLELTEQQMAELCDTIPDQVLDLKLAMLSHSGGAAGSALDALRASLGNELRPLVVGDATEFDAVTILLSRLIQNEPSQSPNIAMVRVSDMRQRARLMEDLKMAEQAAGVTNLPVVVAANSANCFFADGWLGSRRVEQLCVPIRLTRLIRALRPQAAGNRRAA